jgi:phosphatidylglycerol:prolipoprotein diacylglycerol transferase
MLLAVNFPSWLKPEIIPGVPLLRWYGLMYIFAFGAAFLLYRRQVRERNFPMTEDELSGMFMWCILGLLLGARIFSTIVYETSNIYRRQPWLVFWPFRDGRFTGLMGMSYHGGVIGGVLGILIYSAVKRFDWREIGDMYAASIPLGYTFGRLGNFANGELYGRVTTGPLGMIFPQARLLPASEPWVREAAARAGVAVPDLNGLVNLPRHPSQLYEAFFEGIVLWALIWMLRNRKPFKGFLITLYFTGYGLFRFLIEYFREPDEDLGYRIELARNTLPASLAHPLLSFSTGQILSFGMILLGLVWLAAASRLPNREAVIRYPENAGGGASAPAEKPDRDAERNRRRKLRKKLR